MGPCLSDGNPRSRRTVATIILPPALPCSRVLGQVSKCETYINFSASFTDENLPMLTRLCIFFLSLHCVRILTVIDPWIDNTPLELSSKHQTPLSPPFSARNTASKKTKKNGHYRKYQA